MEKAHSGDVDTATLAGAPQARERLVYVLPDEREQPGGDTVSLLELWNVLWRSKRWIVGITAIFTVASIAYSLAQTEWYRADVLLTPAERSSAAQSFSSQLGGLAALAGFNIGGSNNAEAIAVLQSRDFLRPFIEDRDLVPVLLQRRGFSLSGTLLRREPEDPDIRDAVTYFQENVLRVDENTTTELVRLRIEWTDPDVAAEWANELVERLNRYMRNRALKEAETNVAFLERELASTNLVALEQTIGRLLENELQRLMLARGNEEFAFRILDRAQPPKERVRPRRTLTVALATAFGGALATLIVLVRHGTRRGPTATV